MSNSKLHEGDGAAREWRGQWRLAPEVAYLNHGSVGLSPSPVIDSWTDWIRRIDRQRLGFYRREAQGALESARAKLAAFVSTGADNIAFAVNATSAALAVARSFPLEPGDEVLINDHEYWSVIEIWRRACQDAGARLVIAELPVPVSDPESIIEAIFGAATAATRLVIFSHITYRTGIVMPAEAICRRAREKGIATLIDGAHALAQLPLNIDALDCDFYVASCHKWLCAPAGTGFLYANPRARALMKPLTGARHGQWRDAVFMGTQDYSRYLAVPAAIDFMESAGLDYFRERSHALAGYARKRITELTGVEPWCPDSQEWYASMSALPLRDVDTGLIQEKLWRDFAIESYVSTWNGRSLVRVSCHLYTEAAEIDRLVEALAALGMGRAG